ncbi:hypothetical protein, partial [Solemya pervernicosa gill symbiont]
MADKQSRRYSLIAGVGYDDSYDRQYQQHYSRLDPWNTYLEANPVGQAFNTHTAVSDAEFKSSEYYNDFFSHYGVFYGLGGNIIKNENMIARIGVQRARSQGPYTESEMALLQEIMPHLMRAYKLGAHLETVQQHQEGLLEALYRSPTPLILIDEHERVAFVSQQAEAAITSNGGLTVKNSSIKLSSPTEQSKLQEMIRQTVATGNRTGTGSGGGMRVTSEGGEHRFNLIVTPYPARTAARFGFSTRITAAIFIHDTQQASPGSRYFCESLFWASKPKQTAKTSRDRLCLRRPD